MKEIQFTQVLEVEVKTTLYFPEGTELNEALGLIQEFPFNVTVTETKPEDAYTTSVNVQSVRYTEDAVLDSCESTLDDGLYAEARTDEEMLTIIDENYYTLYATGADAMGNLLADMANARFRNYGFSDERMQKLAIMFAQRLTESDGTKWNTPAYRYFTALQR